METATALEDVFRARRLPPCDERVLVLLARGIPAAIEALPDGFAVVVDATDAPAARIELERYQLENRPRPRGVPVKLHPGAYAAAAAYVALLFLVAVAGSRTAFHLDWYRAGVLDGALLRAGELWRAVTALTLHADFAHLAANAGFGALFGALAGRVYGPGVAWLVIVLAAMAANLANGLLMPVGRVSIGASTAVFAALGALAVHRWPAATRRARLGLTGAPVVAALVLLALLGTGDVHTDIAAHALGFGAGALFAVPLRRFAPPPGRLQALAGTLAVGVVLVGWAVALVAERLGA